MSVKSPELEKSFDYWFSAILPVQYEDVRRKMLETGLVGFLPHNESKGRETADYGITGMDGFEYVFPSKEVVINYIKSNKDYFETKFNQGFTEIDITPFALSIMTFGSLLKKEMLKGNKSGGFKKDGDIDGEKFTLDSSKDIIFFDQPWLQDKDKVYFLHDFPENQETYDVAKHGGLSKEEFLEQQRTVNPDTAGYLVTLQEPHTIIPKQGEGKVLGGRKQFETNQLPTKTLQGQKENSEVGQTIEQEITRIIKSLRKGIIINDVQGAGNTVFCTGVYDIAKNTIAEVAFNGRTGTYFFGNCFLNDIGDKLGGRSAAGVFDK